MIKYFTKEYIKECDCEEIQKQKEQLDYCCEIALKIDNDIYADKIYRAFSRGVNNKYLLSSSWDDVVAGIYERSRIVWLPTGDDLDEEIQKICDKKRYEYAIFYRGVWNATIEPIRVITNGTRATEFENLNRNLAKIKLLKALLKELLL